MRVAVTVLGWGVRNVLVGAQPLARAGVEDFKGAFDARVGAFSDWENSTAHRQQRPVPPAFLPNVIVPACAWVRARRFSCRE